jgi:SAM-dependent methyltransferase
MKSTTRSECESAVTLFSHIINQKKNTGNLLYVGIAGDPKGGEYSPLFSNFTISTFDADVKWNPDIVGDITKSSFADNSWDVIICVQVIEHIPNLWDLPKELKRILKNDGYAIIDCPWLYPYHAEPPSFGDYWRVSKDGMKILFQDFELIDIYEGTQNTSCLIRKT